MTVHRLGPWREPVDRPQPALRGVPSADVLAAQRTDPPDVSFAVTRISPEARRAAQRVFASGWVTTGHETERFESEFAAYVGAEHAVGVSSCTAALELALRALRLPPAGTVLIPAVTFCGAAQAVL